MKRSLTLIFVIFLIVWLEECSGEYLTVNTKAGPLLGSCEDGFCSFLGIFLLFLIYYRLVENKTYFSFPKRQNDKILI